MPQAAFNRTGHPAQEAAEAPHGASGVGLPAHPSPRLCCLSFPAAPVFFGISYPGPGVH